MIKKSMFVILTLLLNLSTFGQGTPIITMIADGDETGGIPKVLEIYADGTVDFSNYSLQNQMNSGTTWGNTYDLSPLGIVTNSFVYVYKDGNLNGQSAFSLNFPSVTASQSLDTGNSNIVGFNGDDRVRIIETASGNPIDTYGVDGQDGTNRVWEYKDGFSKRVNQTGPDTVFDENNWSFNNGGLNGHGAVQDGTTYESIIGIGTYIPANAATCNPPTHEAAMNITDTSADLTWSPGGNESSWSIEYGLAGFTQGQGTSLSVNTNPYTLTALTPGTSYDWYIRANCSTGVSSSWDGPFSFTTTNTNGNPCVGIVPDYTQDFTNYLPQCWKEAKGFTGSLIMTNNRWTYDGFLNQGATGAARVYVYGTSQHTSEWLISPSFDLSNGNYELSFKVGITGFSNTGGVTMGIDDSISLLVSTDGGNTWNYLIDWNSNNNPSNVGNYYAFDLANFGLGGNPDVRFAYFANAGDTAQNGYNFYVDDFVITQTACPAPIELNTTITGTTSTILSWVDNTGGTASYIIEWKAVGASTWNSVNTAIGATSYTLTGLTPDTEYQWRITSDCGGGLTGVTVSGNNFIPTCVPIVPDYLQEFTGFLDECWMEGKGNMSTFFPANSRWTNDGFANNGTTGAARVRLYTNAYDSWLISPEFYLSGGPYMLSMDVAVTKFSGSYPSQMGNDDEVNVQISTDGGVNWHVLYTWTANNVPSNYGENVMIDLSNYNGFAKFAIVASDGSVADLAYNFYVDNFHIFSSVARPDLQPTQQTATYDIKLGQNKNMFKIFSPQHKKMLHITAYDMYGFELYRGMNLNTDEIQIPVKTQKGSLVIFKIEMTDHSVITKKAVKQ